MKNLIIAKRVVNNECEMYLVYAKTEAGEALDRVLFQTRTKALKFAFLLKKRHEAIITKAAMAILSAPKAEAAAAVEPEAEEKPVPKKRGRKPSKKVNAEAQ